ncbi:MAG: CDP-glucose 4,6-dehydratase [Aureispira sp.]|nr:CDP-glucose 4,6-dehydratase [Aureispira sp.]
MKTLEEYYKGKKVFLTGHTGFKGTWMLVLLQKLGATVKGFALDPEQLSLYNDVKGDNLCDSVIADIREQDKVKAAIKSFQPDIVFHMAAQPLVLDSYKEPVYTFAVNAMGTANLLEAVKEVEGKCAMVNITTDKVYENKEWYYPYRENDHLGGYDPYSASKACAEIVTASYRSSFFNPNDYETHQKSIATVRAGNVIGGGDWAANRIIPDIVKAVTNHETVMLRSPNAVRPWQHVLEALYGYLLLGIRLDKEPQKFATAFNFGPLYDEAVTVEDLVKTAIDVWQRGKYEVLKQHNHPHEAKLLRLDCSKAVNMLEWTPRWNARKAIRQTIEWYKKVVQDNKNPLATTQEQIDAYLNA